MDQSMSGGGFQTSSFAMSATNGQIPGAGLIIRDGPHRVISTAPIPDGPVDVPDVIVPASGAQEVILPLERGTGDASRAPQK
jgi:hypothetical protein